MFAPHESSSFDDAKPLGRLATIAWLAGSSLVGIGLDIGLFLLLQRLA
jgi:hypothetical protein